MDVSPKALKALADAESRNGLGKTSPETLGDGPRAEESRAPYGQPQAFTDYLAMLRGMREEAERLAGGDKSRAVDLFESMLKAWTDTVTTKRRGTNHPFGSSDRAAIDEAKAAIARFDAARAGEATAESPVEKQA